MLNPLDTTTSLGETLARQINALREQIANLERSRSSPYRITAESLEEAESMLPVPGGANGQIVIAQGWNLPVMFMWVNENGVKDGNWYIVNAAMSET